LGPLQRPRIEPQAEYVEFQKEMTAVIDALLPEEPAAAEPIAVRPKKNKPARSSPFYEIFAETKDLEFVESLPRADFSAPADYKKL